MFQDLIQDLDRHLLRALKSIQLEDYIFLNAIMVTFLDILSYFKIQN
jgi:hypothetical protein